MGTIALHMTDYTPMSLLAAYTNPMIYVVRRVLVPKISPHLLYSLLTSSMESLMIAHLQGRKKVKVKVAVWDLFNTTAVFGLLYSYPQQVPAFISRGSTHHTDARDLYQLRRELLPMNFASKSVIYGRTRIFTDSFTSPPKEGILRIFGTPEKSNSFGRV